MAKYFLISLFSVLCLCACSNAGEEDYSSQTLTETGVLAKVGGEEITQEDFDKKAQNLDEDFSSFIKTPVGRDNFLDLIISERLFLKEAQNEGLDKDEGYQKQVDDLQEQLKQNFAAAKEFMLLSMLSEKLKKEGVTSVSEEEIKAYYKKYPYQISLLQILVTDAQLAADLTKQLKGASQARFLEAVKKFSIDPVTKDNGGRLEPFIPGEYIAEIEIAAANTPVMQVQGFFKTAHGFHIIMKTGEEALSYPQAKDKIQQILEKQKQDAYLNSLKQKYGVEVKYESK